MKISLFQGILFGIFGVAALIGLFVFATHTGNPSGDNTVGKVVIWGTLPRVDMQAVLTAVGQTETTMKDVSYVEKNPATLASDLATAIATGGSPDLVLASQEELHALSKFITPIPSSTLPARTFTNAFIGGGQIFTAPNGSGYWGIPFLVDPLALFWNRSILASNGIAKPPATWEALTGLVPKVAVLTPSRQIERGLIALGTYNNVQNARGILSALFLQTGVPVSGYAASGALVAALGAATTGQAALGFYTQFADPSKVSYTWNASLRDSRSTFLAGDTALYLGYVSESRSLRTGNPNLDVDVMPLPQPGTAQVKTTYGRIYAFMIPRGTRNGAGAYQAAVLLTGADAQSAAATLTGLAPVVLNVLTDVPADPVGAVAYTEALYARGWLSPLSADTDAVFSGMINDVISGRSNLETALANAERSLSALLQQ